MPPSKTLCRSCFYIVVRTFEIASVKTYPERAGKLANLLHDTFTDTEKLLAMTKSAKLESAHTEVEITHEEMGVEARCVLDLWSKCKKAPLDKTRLVTLLRSTQDFPDMKVEKRQVPPPVPEWQSEEVAGEHEGAIQTSVADSDAFSDSNEPFQEKLAPKSHKSSSDEPETSHAGSPSFDQETKAESK